MVRQMTTEPVDQARADRPGGLADEVFTSGETVLCIDHPSGEHKLSRIARDE
jgi:hypothetical protein